MRATRFLETTTMLIRLQDPEIVELVGTDALAFAQAQFASDVAALAPGHWQWSSWLSAQGRVRAFFMLWRLADADERFLLVLQGGSARRLREALSRFVLRAKVKIDVASNLSAFIAEDSQTLAGTEPLPGGTDIALRDGCRVVALPGIPRRWLLIADTNEALPHDDSASARNREALAEIDAGIVTVADVLEDKLLPDWIGLAQIGAISVRKGCYPGQEVVARLHFKGGNKRWLHRVTFSASSLPAPGTWLPAEGENAALVICAAWSEAGRGRALVIARDGIGPNTISSSTHAVAVHSIERVKSEDSH